ncbi:hypothetical protein [Streptomyces davaonensis]|nr:hypothetical protein [Streptomyces davaonensis]
MTPDSAPIDARAPYSGSPTASPTANGNAIPTAARPTAAQFTGAA